MKKSHALASIALIAIVLVTAIAILRHLKSTQQRRLDGAHTQLTAILVEGNSMSSRPAPANQIQELMVNDYGRKLLTQLDESQQRLAIDPSTGAYICVWNGPNGQQVLFVDPGSNAGVGPTVSMPSQVDVEEVRIDEDEVVIAVAASSATDDENEVRDIFGLEPSLRYRARIKMADLSETDWAKIWKSGTPRSDLENVSRQ